MNNITWLVARSSDIQRTMTSPDLYKMRKSCKEAKKFDHNNTRTVITTYYTYMAEKFKIMISALNNVH